MRENGHAYIDGVAHYRTGNTNTTERCRIIFGSSIRSRIVGKERGKQFSLLKVGYKEILIKIPHKISVDTMRILSTGKQSPMNLVMEATSARKWAETGPHNLCHTDYEKSCKTVKRKYLLFSSRVPSGKRGSVLVMAREQGSNNSTKRGWFYDTFVKENSMDAKLSKFKSDVAARDGYVGSWFQDSFKYTAWIEVHRKLTERNLQSIECKEAYNLAKSGKAILLDARESGDFEKVHVENAKNAPLFRLIQGNDLKANMRRLGYALLTDFAGTERNPYFIDQAIDAVGGNKRKKVIVMCAIGGTLQTYVERKGPKAKKFKDPERMFGRQSRSLKAVYELQEAGFTNVIHLKDGVNEWIHLGLPIAGTNS